MLLPCVESPCNCWGILPAHLKIRLCPPCPDRAPRLRALLRSIPRLDKRSLSLIRVLLCTDFFDADLRAILGEHDILLFHLADAALGELVRVEVDLGIPC